MHPLARVKDSWHVRITKVCGTILRKQRFLTPPVMPLNSDIVKVVTHLNETIEHLLGGLENNDNGDLID